MVDSNACLLVLFEVEFHRYGLVLSVLAGLSDWVCFNRRGDVLCELGLAGDGLMGMGWALCACLLGCLGVPRWAGGCGL